jgi:hypothetical protein
MAYLVQVLSQVTARIVDWRVQQIFDVLLFRHHMFDDTAPHHRLKLLTPPEPSGRKSCIVDFARHPLTHIFHIIR